MAVPGVGTTSRTASGLPARRLLLALLAVYLPFFALYFASPVAFSLPHAAAACGGRPILDQRWGYTAQQAADYLSACGASGRAAIGVQQAADLVYPALFGAVLVVALTLLLRAVGVPERHWTRALLLLPVITTAADYLENAGIRALLASYPGQPPIVPAMSAVTMVKLATGWACMAVLVALGALAAFRRLRSQVTRPALRRRGLPAPAHEHVAGATGRRPPAPLRRP